MAAVKTLVGSSLLIQIGNGASPEVFAHDCLINTARGLQIDSDQVEIVVPDCDNPALPGWRQLSIDNLKGLINGAGVLHTVSYETWFDWLTAGTEKNVRVVHNVAGSLGGGYVFGAFKLASLTTNAPSNKEYTTVEVSLMSHGELDWVDLP